MNFLKKICNRYIKQLYIRWKEAAYLLARFISRVMLFVVNSVKESKYPTTIQLPITYKCNFDCVMCGMRKLISKPGFTQDELKQMLSNPLFKKVKSVGVNGGEPFILNNIEEYIQVLFEVLPNLKHIHIISNGYFTAQILNKSKQILDITRAHNGKYHLSISIDGYQNMQDQMRGKKGAFSHAVETCDSILKDKNSICDDFGTICTITKINADYLAELDTWAIDKGLSISYNIATIHKRIENEDRFNNFSIFTDEHAKQMAEEFFYGKFLETKSDKYYSLYYYIHTGCRISACAHKKSVATITPDGGLAYCATFSKELGNLYNSKADKLFFKKENLFYRNDLQKQRCKHCSHYTEGVSLRNYMPKYFKECMRATKIFR